MYQATMMSSPFRLLAILLLTLLVNNAEAVAAENYIIVDNQTGYVLGAKDRDEKVQIASLTKIATAIVVLDWAQLKNEDLSQMAQIPGTALTAGGVNPAGLQPGDSVSVRDLIYCAMLASDNVAATALAAHVGAKLPNAQGLDPVGNFVAHMNALARSLAMKRTLFLNPTGFDGGEQTLPYSTAEDMARLTRYGYNQAAFPFYVSQQSRQIHVLRGGAEQTIELKNTNELLGVDGIDGVKTGRTSLAGDCVILSADRSPESTRQGEKVFVTPRRIIVVVLKSPDRFGEGLALFRQGWGLYDQWAAKGRKVKSSQAL